MTTIEGAGDKNEDLRGFPDGAHRIVYNSMFVGITLQFMAFGKESS
jgi:hypothetical protein